MSNWLGFCSERESSWFESSEIETAFEPAQLSLLKMKETEERHAPLTTKPSKSIETSTAPSFSSFIVNNKP